MKDLFTPLTRDERQEESVKKWLKAKGRGTIVACTGYGFYKEIIFNMNISYQVINLF